MTVVGTAFISYSGQKNGINKGEAFTSFMISRINNQNTTILLV